MTTLTATPVKTITYDRLTGDYKMELDGEFVGYERSYHAAEVELDRLAYEQLDRAGVEPEMLLSATALDGVCACGAVFNEHGQCEACLVLRERLLAIIATDEPVLAQLLTTPDPGHDLITPDPAECPDISAPQPVENLPTSTGNRLLDEAGDLLTRLIDLTSHLCNDVPSGETMSARCARLSRLRRANYAMKRAGRRVTRRFAALPVNSLSACIAYSTPPLALLIEPESEPVPAWLNAPINPADVPEVEPEHDPCAALRVVLEEAIEWWDNVPKTINHMRPAWVERARVALKR